MDKLWLDGMPLHEDDDQPRYSVSEVARAFDVPAWLVHEEAPRPRFARLRWMVRRIWPL